MTTKQRILIAVASGCTNTRQVANFIGVVYGTVNNHFYDNGAVAEIFVNGDLVQWTPGKANTLRLGPNAVVQRKDGQIVAVGRAEKT